MLEHRMAVLPHHVDGVFLLHRVDEAVQVAREPARLGEHVQLGARRKSVIGRQMRVAVDLEPERRERVIERLVVPLAGVDQHAEPRVARGQPVPTQLVCPYTSIGNYYPGAT